MSKIIAISDMHLGIRPYGLREREEDIYKVFHDNIWSIIEEKPELVIFCGDAFDKAKPSPYALNEYQKGINRLFEEDIKVLYILGNHTKLLTKGHLEPEKIFNNERYIHLNWGEDGYYTDDDYLIIGLDYHYVDETEILLDKLKQIEKKIKISRIADDKICILVLHQAIGPYCGNFGADIDIEDIPSCFDIILNGHIHNRELIHLDDFVFCQPGSLERLTAAEHKNHIANGKGYTVIENYDINFKDTELERVMLPYQIDLNEASFEESSNIIRNVIKENKWDIQENKKPLIYIKIRGTDINYYEVEEFKKQLAKYSLYINCDIKNEAEDEWLLDLEENLDEYLDINKAIEKGGEKSELDKLEVSLAKDIFNSKDDKENIEAIVKNFFDEYFKEKHIEEHKKFLQKEKEFEEKFKEIKDYFNHLGEEY